MEYSHKCGIVTVVLIVTLRSMELGAVEATPVDIEKDIEEFVAEHSAQRLRTYAAYMQARWNYYTNITDHNQDIMNDHKLAFGTLKREAAVKARKLVDLQGDVFNATLKRMVNKILDVGIDAYDNKTVLEKINRLKNEMIEIYSLAAWCKTANDCKPIEPALVDIMATSRDYDELRDVWKGWRDVSGKKMRHLYTEYAALKNEVIRATGRYNDIGEYYRSWYESPTFEDGVRELFTELRPLYDQLHAYVRFKLREFYGEERFPETGHIPAHLLGNMWAQRWTDIYDLLVPYPGHNRTSVTDKMKEQSFTVDRMYRLAEGMFTSIGLGPMPRSFWTNSMLEEPTDGRKVVCHASAWDMHNRTDFRIKQCTTVTEDQFITVQHEMGHIIYYNEYWRQHVLFREGANPGFHEGVASLITMSAVVPEYLKRIGLVDTLPSGQEQDINVLLKVALDGVAFLPFGYLIDQWRWSLYRGDVTTDNLNSAWWDLRCAYQGVSPPVERSEDDFDPGAKYHIPGNYPYIRYFVSSVARYQWQDALCELIGHTGPLHRCSLYGHKTAGKRLRQMLRMGSSRPWSDAMRAVTRGTSGETDRLSANSILKFFQPLLVWLQKENEKNGESVGWNKTVCPNVLYKTIVAKATSGDDGGPTVRPSSDVNNHASSVNSPCHILSLCYLMCLLLFVMYQQ